MLLDAQVDNLSKQTQAQAIESQAALDSLKIAQETINVKTKENLYVTVICSFSYIFRPRREIDFRGYVFNSDIVQFLTGTILVVLSKFLIRMFYV